MRALLHLLALVLVIPSVQMRESYVWVRVMRWSVCFLLFCGLSLCEAGWHFDTQNLNDICTSDDFSSCLIDAPRSDENCFRAAVYEHNHRRDDYNDSQLTVERNLDTYERVTKLAAENGANIMVFPEDGLFLDIEGYMDSVVEYVPDPKLLTSANRNPCLRPEFYKDSKILRRLSCIARNSNLYLVVNYGTKDSCEHLLPGQVCRPSGVLLFNTDVVLDPQGNLIARYRKYNIYTLRFDKPPLELVYFDSPYGRFGLMTCFDLIYKSPPIDLVEQHHIDHAILLTYWYDELPFLAATQYQDGWSLANKVNFLGANNHVLDAGTVGSGIYSREHIFYTSPNSLDSRLLLANVPKKFSQKCTNGYNPKSIVLDSEEPGTKYYHTNYVLKPNDTYHILDRWQATKTICSGKVCCTIDYTITGESLTRELNRVILIVSDGNVIGKFARYEQFCSLATLEPDANLQNLTFSTSATPLNFETLSLEATFTTKYVVPVASHSLNQLIERHERSFSCSGENEVEKWGIQTCWLVFDGGHREPRPVFSFTLFGRHYDLDKPKPKGY